MNHRRSLIKELGGVCLDVGCNNNPEIHKEMVEKLGQKNVYGLDLKKDNLEGFKNIGLGDANYVGKLYQPNTFDSVYAAEIIEHLENPFGFLKGCYEVMKKEGKIVITTPNMNSFRYMLSKMIGGKNPSINDEHLYAWDLTLLERLVEKAGFDVFDWGYIKGGGINGFIPQKYGWHIYVVARK